MKLTTKQATEEHAVFVAKNMRDVDVQECSKTSNLRPKVILLTALYSAGEVFTFLLDDEPVALFGFPLDGMGGRAPWLLGTDKSVDPEALKYWAKTAPVFIDTILKRTEYLQHRVWKGSKKHVRWLKFMGFELTQNEHPEFWTFTKRRSPNV